MMAEDLVSDYYFVHCWNTKINGVKGCFLHKTEGDLLLIKENSHFIIDYEKLKKLKKKGLIILRGREKARILRRFRYVFDKETKTIRPPQYAKSPQNKVFKE